MREYEFGPNVKHIYRHIILVPVALSYPLIIRTYTT